MASIALLIRIARLIRRTPAQARTCHARPGASTSQEQRAQRRANPVESSDGLARSARRSTGGANARRPSNGRHYSAASCKHAGSASSASPKHRSRYSRSSCRICSSNLPAVHASASSGASNARADGSQDGASSRSDERAYARACSNARACCCACCANGNAATDPDGLAASGSTDFRIRQHRASSQPRRFRPPRPIQI